MTCSYGLKVFVPSKSLCWNPNPWCDGISRRGHWDEHRWWGRNPHEGKRPQGVHYPSSMWRYEERVSCNPESSSLDPDHVGSPNSASQPLVLWEIHFLLTICLPYSVLKPEIRYFQSWIEPKILLYQSLLGLWEAISSTSEPLGILNSQVRILDETVWKENMAISWGEDDPRDYMGQNWKSRHVPS